MSFHGQLGTLKKGQSLRVKMSTGTPGGVSRDYSGAVVSAWARPVAYEDSDFQLTAILDDDPSTPPQLIIDISAAQSATLTVPGRIDIDATVTLQGGATDKPSGYLVAVAADHHAA